MYTYIYVYIYIHIYIYTYIQTDNMHLSHTYIDFMAIINKLGIVGH